MWWYQSSIKLPLNAIWNLEKKMADHQILVRMWSKGNSYSLRWPVNSTNLENSLTFPAYLKIYISYGPRIPILVHIIENFLLTSPWKLTQTFSEQLWYNSLKCKQPKCPPTVDWINKSWYIYICYNNVICGKWTNDNIHQHGRTCYQHNVEWKKWLQNIYNVISF